MKIKLFYKSLFVILIAFALQFTISLWINNFNFAYALDDPYIHLAIAKNFSNYGVWGPTKFEFASSSSSILYTLLISTVNFLGVKSVIVPMILNLIFTALMIFSLIKIFKICIKDEKSILVFTLIILILSPIVALILSGMEHIAHISFILLTMNYLMIYISHKNNNDLYKLLIFSTIAVGFRYESLFVVLAICIVFAMQKDYRALLLTGIISPSIVIIFGVISLANGDYFLPNTLLIKGITPDNDFTSFLHQLTLWITRAVKYPHILSSMIIAVGGIFYFKKFPDLALRYLSLITFISWILHLTFAGIGWFYRYEAYLIVLSLLILAIIFYQEYNKINTLLSIKKLIVLTILLMLPFAYRLTSSIYRSSFAPKNIYQQQIKMAHYIQRNHYNSIVLNDIGAVCYYNDIKILDVLGLGTTEVVKAIKEKRYNTQFLLKLSRAKKSKIAFLYQNILPFQLPDNWQIIDSIKIKHNVICWDDVVYIYKIKIN